MKCKFTRFAKDWKRDTWIEYPCGKCLPCRIRKRSAWCLRLQLEAQRSLSRSFWTLTLNDDSLTAASEDERRTTIRNFIAALRASESRKGNIAPIRFFGCLEYGGSFGRPHWHMLVFNLMANYRPPSKYHRGLPRPLCRITQWPHGHVDVAEFNLATVNYVCDYLTDFSGVKGDVPSIPVRTIRPAIGYYGLKAFAQEIVKERSILLQMPTSFTIGTRHYPIDRWTRDTFIKLYEEAGGRYRPQGTPKKRYRLRLIEERAILDATPRLSHIAEQRKEAELYGAILAKETKRETREREISARYDRLKAA